MADRCNALTGRGQCRATQHLSRTRVTVYRSPHFKKKIPGDAVIMLCPRHLRLSPLEWLLLSDCKTKPAPPAEGAEDHA